MKLHLDGSCGVYPRVCGGTSRSASVTLPSPGLSPRVRGNHDCDEYRLPYLWSIPACAGEPHCQNRLTLTSGVYPRVCGGTLPYQDADSPPPGLSPRVRGNRNAPARGMRCLGSIPACAGEPGARRHRIDLQKVYPRVCGGTDDRPTCYQWVNGLSPRVRGNPLLL